MPPSNVKDLLLSFSPSLEYYAVSHGDGRIKIWDTLKGHLQTEFADLATAGNDFLQPKPENGHLSLDYKCMQWVQSGKKKKNKHGQSLLVLGTGSGDVLAVDVSIAQQKWRVSDCHPGGVTAISFSAQRSSIYTAGFDGIVCQLDFLNGNVLGKFKASANSISSLATSADGKMLATASAQIKVFSCSDNKKVQKFSGHPVGVRCMAFSEDGEYIISSAIGEKFIALWRIDASKNQSSCCAFSMEQPAVSVDIKGSCKDEHKCTGLFVLAVSEAGICYFWHEKSITKLSSVKATKISVNAQDALSKKNSVPPIYSARFKDIFKPASGHVLVAYGSLVKPCFEKVSVQHGIDVNIHYSQDGALFPQLQHQASHKEQVQMRVTTLDCANAEDAAIPMAKIHDYQDKKRKHGTLDSGLGFDMKMMHVEADDHISQIMGKVHQENIEDEVNVVKMEDKLKSVGILSVHGGFSSENNKFSSAFLDSAFFKKACSFIEANKPAKKVKESLLQLFQEDASRLLESLILMWKTRSVSEQSILPWISSILVSHNQQLPREVIDTLHKMTRFKCAATETLLQLSGRLQLITAQMGKVNIINVDSTTEDHVDRSDDEDDDVDVDEVVFGHEECSSENEED